MSPCRTIFLALPFSFDSSASMKPRLRIFFGVLKDKTSLLKLSFSPKRTTSSIKAAVLRATARGTAVPPPEWRVDAVLAIGKLSRANASKCVSALVHRLHRTRNSSVALKCLYLIHCVITKGSFVFKDELCFCIFSGDRNYLNLSTFRDDRDAGSLELSPWVRWFAGVLEQNLITSRVLGHFCSPSWKKNKVDGDKKVLESSNSVLLEEIESLESFIEQICSFPDSLHVRKSDIVHEIVIMVSEDYRVAQREILVRVVELGNRVPSLSSGELTRSLTALKRLEDCRGRLFLLFVNRKRNDEFWGLISKVGVKLERERTRSSPRRLMYVSQRQVSELITFMPLGL